LPIVEDEPYRELGFRDPAPLSLFELDPGQSVIHIGTFSKTLAGGLRLGWIQAARPMLDHLATVKSRTDVCSASLSQLCVAGLIERGQLDSHLQRLRAELSARCLAMLQAIRRHLTPGSYEVASVGGGIFLWLRLTEGVRTTSVATMGDRLGVT